MHKLLSAANNITDRFSDTAEILFKIIYLCFAFCTYCAYTYATGVMSIWVDLVILAGAVICIMRLLKIKSYLKEPALILLFMFLGSFVLSAGLNYKYGIADNVKYLIWTSFHFFLLFAYNKDKSRESQKREFEVISCFFILVMFLMSGISIIQYFSGYTHEEYFPDRSPLLAGFVWGRLWGVFYDPNYASVFAVIAIVFSAYRLQHHKNRLLSVFFVLNIIIQILYIAYSDSRTGIVALGICVFVYLYLFCIKQNGFKKIGKQVIVFVAVIAITISPVIVKDFTNSVRVSFAEKQCEQVPDSIETDSTDSDGGEIQQEVTRPVKPEIIVGREQDIEGDVSNRRFALWKSSFEIFKTAPVFGTSYFNLVPYCQDKLPDAYLINNDHGLFNNFHNTFFNILAGQGLFGIVTTVLIAVYFLIRIIPFIFRKEEREEASYFAVIMAVISGGVVSSMLLTDVVYVNSPVSVLFWLFAGYLLSNCPRKEKHTHRG